MSFFDKIFSRKKKKEPESITGMPQSNEVTLKKIFGVSSMITLPFRTSQKFYEDGIDPLADERQKQQGMPSDWLLHDRRLPMINAETNKEIALAKRQFINMLYTIESLDDLERGVEVYANDILSRVNEEIEGYENEIHELRQLLRK